MKLRDVATTPDSQRLVGVGPLRRSPTGLLPSRSRVEKRIVGMCIPCYTSLHTQYICQSITWKLSRLKGKHFHIFIIICLLSSVLVKLPFSTRSETLHLHKPGMGLLLSLVMNTWFVESPRPLLSFDIPPFFFWQAAPQLWKLELVKDREDNTIVTARLSLRSVR